jgi:hypothetical protein
MLIIAVCPLVAHSPRALRPDQSSVGTPINDLQARQARLSLAKRRGTDPKERFAQSPFESSLQDVAFTTQKPAQKAMFGSSNMPRGILFGSPNTVRSPKLACMFGSFCTAGHTNLAKGRTQRERDASSESSQRRWLTRFAIRLAHVHGGQYRAQTPI